MILLQNTKPKITKPKIPSQKNFDQILNSCKKTKLKILDGHEQEIMKIDNPNI